MASEKVLESLQNKTKKNLRCWHAKVTPHTPTNKEKHTHPCHAAPLANHLGLSRVIVRAKLNGPSRVGRAIHALSPRAHTRPHWCLITGYQLSPAVGPSLRLTLLSSKPHGAKLFKYSSFLSHSLPALILSLSLLPSPHRHDFDTRNLSFNCCQFQGNPFH